MIITKFFKTRRDGVNLYRTYSDAGRTVVREDGAVFDEAVDVENSVHSYTEGEPLPDEEITAEEALAIITGGADDETE
ncbi:MAG: hypothetical protein E7579_04260 [Ruminococcaceae bacterium]|nr:hypothetical protein [Oscillospiraceae bacterium]